MNMNKAAFGAQKERVLKILPDDMDPEAVKEFFANTKFPFPALDQAGEKAEANLGDLAPPFAAGQAPEIHVLEVDDSGIPLLAPMSGCSCPKEKFDPGGDAAQSGAYDLDTVVAAAPEDDALLTEMDAAAKGGWKTKGSDPDSTDSPGKGNGRNKKEPTQEETTDETTSEPTTDTSGSGTTSEPAPVEEAAPEPALAPVEETATDTSGSNNYITDAADHVTGLSSTSDFNISIVFEGAWTETQKLMFIDGAELVSEYVYGDLPDSDGIDDMHITAVSKDVSGWAYGGPRSFHDSGLTKTGEVTFNSANLGTAESYGVIDDFAFHEILHAMGIGTSWGGNDFVENIGGETRFTGQNAIEAYNAPDSIYAGVAGGDEFSLLGVPLDSSGNHLNESYFGADMMTPTLSLNNVVSDLSIAMLEDIGYETVYGDEPVEELVYDDPLLM